MLKVRSRMREVLARPECTPVANIFDPLSAHIASLVGFEVCKLSGSVGKFATLGVPDEVPLSNATGLADHCRRILQIAPDISLIVDVDDGFGNALQVRRTVQEVEASGAAAIEIEDNYIAPKFGDSGSGLVSKAEQVGKLRAALDTRRDADTVITARSAAIAECSLDEAIDRIGAYSETGVDALMLVGGRRLGRAELEAVHEVAPLPKALLSPPPEVRNDAAFLRATQVKILYLGNPAFAIAVKALHDCFEHLLAGGDPAELRERQAPPELQRRVSRTDEFTRWQEDYIP